MTNQLTLFLAQVEAPGTGIGDRLYGSLIGLGQAIMLVAAVLVGFAILFSIMPRWAGLVFGFLLVASFFTAPDVWWDWITYIAAGDDATASIPSTTTTVPGGDG